MNRREMIKGALATAAVAALPASKAFVVEDVIQEFIDSQVSWDLAVPGSEYMAMIVYCEGEILKITGISAEMLGAP